MLPKEKWAKILCIFAYVIIICCFLWLFFTKAFRIILPFLLAYLVALCQQGAIEKLENRIKINRKAIAIGLNTLVIALLLFAGFLLLRELLSELKRFFDYLGDNSKDIVGYVENLPDKMAKKFPQLKKYIYSDTAKQSLKNMTANGVATVSSFATDLMGKGIVFFPSCLINIGVFVLSSYYFTSDFQSVNSFVSKILPSFAKNILQRFKTTAWKTGTGYLKGYATIMLITTAELLVGFIIIGVEYALGSAFIVALCDMLPIIGVGTVLVPWAVISFIMGNVRRGVGLLIIFGVVSIVRQIIEPRILGGFLGMHPLITLVSMFIGLKLFGFVGLIILPVAVMIGLKFVPS